MTIESERNERAMGVQPLDALLIAMGRDNHEVVGCSTEHLTHKVVMKARRGRRLTLRMQGKVLRACNQIPLREKPYVLADLFNYEGD